MSTPAQSWTPLDENADNLTGANRKVAMEVVHLIELAQRQVDSVIEEQPAG